MSLLLEAALEYAANEIAVIPLATPHDGGCSCNRNICTSAGKHPRVNGWQREASKDEGQIREWWSKWPKSNVGIVTGSISNLFVLDVDGKKGADSLNELIDKYGPLPDTPMAITGSGGRHIFFTYPGGHLSNRTGFQPGLDIRGDGGFVVAAPSLHASGNLYQWEFPLVDNVLAPAPDWLLEMISKPSSVAKPASSDSGLIPQGERNERLFGLGLALKRNGRSSQEIEDELLRINRVRCIIPLPQSEVRQIAASVANYGPKYNLTELGNALRLVDKHGADLRYCQAWKQWLVWDGRIWSRDESNEIMRRSKDMVRDIYTEAGRLYDENARNETSKHARRSESEKALKAAINLASSEPGIPVNVEQLDSYPMLLNLKNGILDLETGNFRPHTRELLLTKMAPVEWEPNATCPTWTSFLDNIFSRDKELVEFVQTVIGYSLTGSTKEQMIFLLHGTGANGKSTFLNTLSNTLGDYALQTPANTLMSKKFDGGIPNDIARLRGARLVSAMEADAGQKMSEALVKQLTGGDPITARFLHQEYFEFIPDCKIFLATNHLPEIIGSDYGIWRRICVIPFTVTIPPERQDKDLQRKLEAERSGILNWAVEGALRWQRDGLVLPERVQAATSIYREEMDPLQSFLEERCQLNSSAKVRKSVLYDDYLFWCSVNNESPLSKSALGSKLRERGIASHKGTAGQWFWIGIALQ